MTHTSAHIRPGFGSTVACCKAITLGPLTMCCRTVSSTVSVTMHNAEKRGQKKTFLCRVFEGDRGTACVLQSDLWRVICYRVGLQWWLLNINARSIIVLIDVILDWSIGLWPSATDCASKGCFNFTTPTSVCTVSVSIPHSRTPRPCARFGFFMLVPILIVPWANDGVRSKYFRSSAVIKTRFVSLPDELGSITDLLVRQSQRRCPYRRRETIYLLNMFVKSDLQDELKPLVVPPIVEGTDAPGCQWTVAGFMVSPAHHACGSYHEK